MYEDEMEEKDEGPLYLKAKEYTVSLQKEDPPEGMVANGEYKFDGYQFNGGGSDLLSGIEVVPCDFRSGPTEVTEEPTIPTKLTKPTEPTVSTFKDHFTLPVPSSVVRYRNANGAARVIEGSEFQFVLEESYNKDSEKMEVTIRRIQETHEGLRLLRVSYTIVTAFWAGFLFIFGMQILLFLFLDLAIQLGVTDRQEAKGFAAAGAIFGIIPLVHGLSTSMVLAGAFVMDTWRGHLLIRNFTLRQYSVVIVEWIFFAFFLGLPLFVMCCALLSSSDDWWAITGVFWIGCIAFIFVAFTINVIYYEMRACMEVMRNQFRGQYLWDVVSSSMRCV